MNSQNAAEKKLRLLQEMHGEVLALKSLLEHLCELQEGPAAGESVDAVSRHLAAIDDIRAEIDELDRVGNTGAGVPEISALLIQIDSIHRQNLRLAAKVRDRLARTLTDFRRAGRARAYIQKNGAAGAYFVDRRG
ncbi:hypothetical protein [Desulfofundulus sp.]|uniref:hypothetical protein n=1 Tax=Desulfofundulus sp. TaxID=2282750 RepID=UPI003C75B208